MDIDEIRRKLKDRRLDVVSERTGIHRSTIARVRDNTTEPTHYIVQKLATYLEENP